MKPSERRAASALVEQAEGGELPYPRSSTAEPLITAEEARAADTAICRLHKGLIASSPLASDAEDRVYFCPIGRMYWRYSKQPSGMFSPLRFRGGL
jgi:hypothetical protein